MLGDKTAVKVFKSDQIGKSGCNIYTDCQQQCLSELLITRNSSGDEIANVNFFTTTSSTTFTQCTPEAPEFGEITQNKGHYAVQVTDFGTN